MINFEKQHTATVSSSVLAINIQIDLPLGKIRIYSTVRVSLLNSAQPYKKLLLFHTVNTKRHLVSS